MIHYDVFKNGLLKAVTFSYDDGHENDIPLVKLFDKYGVKATFHLNSARLGELTEEKTAELRERYKGHEISCHTANHGWPSKMNPTSLVQETLNDRIALENIAGYPVKGMSYPYGSFDDTAIGIMRSCGIVYSRTTRATNSFYMPKDFMEWHPTCHHRSASELCEAFLKNDFIKGKLFYIWGHSFELRNTEDWEQYEELLKTLSGLDEVWYATNIEIYEYAMAQRALWISADEKTFYNPTAIDVWVNRNGEILHIPAGQRVTI